MKGKWLSGLLLSASISLTGFHMPAAAEDKSIINLKSDKFEITGQMQIRGTFENNDFDVNRGNDNDSLGFKRLRLVLKGNLTPEIGFFARPELKGANTQLLDAYITLNYKPLPPIYIGTFMTAPSLESNQSIMTGLETLERAKIVDTIRSFEPGIKIEDALLNKKLFYAVSITNGNGNYTQANDNDNYFCAGRATYKILDNLPLGTEKLTLVIGGSYGYNPASATRANDIFSTKSVLGVTSTGLATLTGAELRLTYGRAALQAEYIKTDFNPSDSGLRNIHMDGHYIQCSYFAIPDKLRAVAKHETFDPDNEVTNYKDCNVYTAGLAWFIKGHDLKLEGNYLIRDERVGEMNNNAFLLQLQMLF